MKEKRTMFSKIDFRSRKLIISGICFYTIFIYGIYLFLFRNNDIVYSFVAFAGDRNDAFAFVSFKKKIFQYGSMSSKDYLEKFLRNLFIC